MSATIKNCRARLIDMADKLVDARCAIRDHSDGNPSLLKYATSCISDAEELLKAVMAEIEAKA